MTAMRALFVALRSNKTLVRLDASSNGLTDGEVKGTNDAGFKIFAYDDTAVKEVCLFCY